MDDLSKKNKKYYIMIIISIFMIISGGISSLIIGLKQDRKETYARMEEVNVSNDEYSKMIIAFEDARDVLYEDILTKLTYDNMISLQKFIITNLSNYEAGVDEIEKQYKKIDKLCNNVYYPDSSINTICNSYNTTFEQVNNYFVSDIDTYNKMVDNYNNYIKKTNPNLVVEKYKATRKIKDIDDDGEIVGKDE